MRPKQRLRNARGPDLEIAQPLFGELSLESRNGWMRENPNLKMKIISQWFGVKPRKNHQLLSYCSELQDGYDYGYTANTNNLEGTFIFIADTEYNTNVSVNSNGEIEGTPNKCELTVNAAASKCTLRSSKQQSKQTVPRSSQMSASAPAMMYTSQQAMQIKK